jgi:CBS domain containing-hemolysin-like protein
MPSDELTIQLLLVPLLIALNAFFVAAEYAVVAIRKTQIERLRRRGRRRTATAMSRLRARPAAAIGAIQVCITMTNLLLGWIGEPAMTQLLEQIFGVEAGQGSDLFHGVSVTAGFLIVTLFTVVLSELLPKALTLQHVEQVARLTARPILGVLWLTGPLVWVMNRLANAITRPLGLGRVDAMVEKGSTAEDIRLLTSQAAADGVITPRERSLILNTLALGRRTARQIMVPRMRVAWLDLQRTMDQNREVMNEHLYSRLPLCNGGMDHVIGLVPTREFLSAYNAAGESSVLQLLARPAAFAPEQISLDRLLTVFHEQRTQFVFLVDEHGSVTGIVTLRDVVDELLATTAEASPPGAADTEGPPEPFTVAGDTPVHELAARLRRENWPPDRSAATVSGLVVAHSGRIPQAGEQVRIDDVVLTVTESDERLVRRVLVSTSPQP